MNKAARHHLSITSRCCRRPGRGCSYSRVARHTRLYVRSAATQRPSACLISPCMLHVVGCLLRHVFEALTYATPASSAPTSLEGGYTECGMSIFGYLGLDATLVTAAERPLHRIKPRSQTAEAFGLYPIAVAVPLLPPTAEQPNLACSKNSRAHVKHSINLARRPTSGTKTTT